MSMWYTYGLYLFKLMVNVSNYDGYSSDMTNQKLIDGEKILLG